MQATLPTPEKITHTIGTATKSQISEPLKEDRRTTTTTHKPANSDYNKLFWTKSTARQSAWSKNKKS